MPFCRLLWSFVFSQKIAVLKPEKRGRITSDSINERRNDGSYTVRSRSGVTWRMILNLLISLFFFKIMGLKIKESLLFAQRVSSFD